MTRRGVYVLELNSGCFYVGSSEDIDSRVAQHRDSPVFRVHGGVFRVHQPMTQHNQNIRIWERDETLRRMMEHGIDRVRGGEFMGDKLSSNHLNTITTLFFGDFDLCRRCGYRGHYQTNCTTDQSRCAAWLCEIERLQNGLQGQNTDHNGGNFVNLVSSESDDDGFDERKCDSCGAGMGNQPEHHYLCYDCYL